MIQVYSVHNDNVIDSKFLVCNTDYKTGIENLYGLISKLDMQRKLQDPKFYERLGRDLLEGCIMPPLTIAFKTENKNVYNYELHQLEDYINKNINSGFILDGIQRLNTLKRTFDQNSERLDITRPLFLNVIICDSADKLLYRMITLNNGQKPMSARHQIEILADNFLGDEKLPISIETEKDPKINKETKKFKKADIVSAYIAFLTGLINYDSQKIIKESMDSLIADKVLSYDIKSSNTEFKDVLTVLEKFSVSEKAFHWFKTTNNLIGFSVGIKKSFNELSEETVINFEKSIEVFNSAFADIDVSQIKLQKERRKLSKYFIENYSVTKNFSQNDLVERFLDIL